jgi:hypothetical protein
VAHFKALYRLSNITIVLTSGQQVSWLRFERGTPLIECQKMPLEPSARCELSRVQDSCFTCNTNTSLGEVHVLFHKYWAKRSIWGGGGFAHLKTNT